MIIQATNSPLILSCTKALDLLLESDLPPVIYRDFDEDSHRQNFVKGNIWFSGTNQNRFFLKDDSRRDKYEYRNGVGSHIFKSSLSFTIRPPELGKPIIIIRDVKGFLIAIKNDLERTANEKSHVVTWLPITELQHHKALVPVISKIEKYPVNGDEAVMLHISSIGCGHVSYEKKILKLTDDRSSIEIANNAYKKSIKFIHEEEWRIWLNMGDFLPPFSGNALGHLVKYLKLQCPSIRKYCEVVNNHKEIFVPA